MRLDIRSSTSDFAETGPILGLQPRLTGIRQERCISTSEAIGSHSECAWCLFAKYITYSQGTESLRIPFLLKSKEGIFLELDLGLVNLSRVYSIYANAAVRHGKLLQAGYVFTNQGNHCSVPLYTFTLPPPPVGHSKFALLTQAAKKAIPGLTDHKVFSLICTPDITRIYPSS